MQEIWKDIYGYNGRYSVSNLGNVKRIYTIKYNKKNKKNEKIYIEKNMTLFTDKCGYKNISLIKDKKRKTKKVHRLVAEAFIPNPKNKPQINHKNGIKSDNTVENLEWCTHQENQTHAWKTGLRKTPKKVNQYSLNGKLIKEWNSIKEIEKTLKIKWCNVNACCLGRRKKSHGYIWKYKGE